jgi:hypothetical protein
VSTRIVIDLEPKSRVHVDAFTDRSAPFVDVVVESRTTISANLESIDALRRLAEAATEAAQMLEDSRTRQARSSAEAGERGE